MADTVRAAVQTGPNRIEIQEFPRPRTSEDSALVRIEANGICGSDVEQYRGHLGGRVSGPAIPGHEPLGIIEEIGERAAERWGVSPGDRVAVEVLRPCHFCARCVAGDYGACSRKSGVHGFTPTTVAPGLWGGMAEYMYLDSHSIPHPMRGDLPAELAVMFNVLGAGVRWALHLGGVGLGDTVLVLGSGQRGLASIVAAKAAGAGTVIATGLASDAHKLELARRFGAEHTIVADEEDTVERVQEITDGTGVDVALELTPAASEPVSHALQATRHGGRVVLAGLKGGAAVPLRTDVAINKALTLVGAYGVNAPAYEEAIRILQSERFPLHEMHTHTVALENAAHAVELLAGSVHGEKAVHVSVHP
ncbi:threonine dehydrogenase-like Zn-dependent dehydrogenase [Lipingzhangella halophila]|uniref:Threonine dehydrogenase-like Zn-dependent dehydrogenase n=1 Tax=Lipingzhangella halophila TaxID=1783352 RepID=A0A7W7W2A4_9ACTN|nr:zinc-binding dehydrogenase [Lipingzhangella halophila]MBB4931213.1 threonine dehydrogenase-like Zn-dependent dehydrogenase [Lipingzhangella halophila]